MRALLILIFLATASAAYAQFNQCGRGFCPGGVFGRGFSAPTGAVTPPPSSCTGAIDGSEGCVFPMMGI